MYKSDYDSEFKDDVNFTKKSIVWIVGLLFVIGGAIWFFTRSVNVADTALLRYEEFQEIYNTCAKINTDLGTIRAVDENDKMFSSFSKQAMLTNKKQQLSRWVEDYNAKSKVWNRALWKSNTLPYQLDVSQFTNFTE